MHLSNLPLSRHQKLPLLVSSSDIYRIAGNTVLALAKFHINRKENVEKRYTTHRPIFGLDAEAHNSFSELFQNITRKYSLFSFTRMFRMSRFAFLKILAQAKPYFHHQMQRHTTGKWETLPPDIRPGLIIRILGEQNFWTSLRATR